MNIKKFNTPSVAVNCTCEADCIGVDFPAQCPRCGGNQLHCDARLSVLNNQIDHITVLSDDNWSCSDCGADIEVPYTE